MTNLFVVLAGVIGNVAFGIGSVQLAWATWKAGKNTVPLDTAITYVIACVAFSLFLVGTYGWNWLFGVMGVETVSWLMVVWYRFFPRVPLPDAIWAGCMHGHSDTDDCPVCCH